MESRTPAQVQRDRETNRSSRLDPLQVQDYSPTIPNSRSFSSIFGLEDTISAHVAMSLRAISNCSGVGFAAHPPLCRQTAEAQYQTSQPSRLARYDHSLSCP